LKNVALKIHPKTTWASEVIWRIMEF